MIYDKKLNYIRHLNDLDKIWKIKIFNDGEETVRGLQIKLSFVPDFAESWIGHIDEIKAGERADINEPNLVINPEKLLSYNEKLEGNIIVELMPADGQSEAVYKEAFPLTVLPYDQLYNYDPDLADPIKNRYRGEDSDLPAYFKAWFQMLRDSAKRVLTICMTMLIL